MTLTILANEPVAEQGLYSREYISDITTNVEGYTHTVSAVGGFDTANFTLKGTRDELQDWFDDGIMRRIEVINPEGIQVWEGYVSRMRYVVGTLVKTKTIDSMSNRVYMRYAPILDLSVLPPVVGSPETIVVDDIASQQNYGVKALIASGGERVDNTANEWAANLLNDQKDIQIGETVNTLAGDALSMEIECRGYWHSLKWLPYISSATGSIQAHEVIIEILEYFNSINSGWLPQTFDWLDYNFATSRRGYDTLQTCQEVIKGIINSGGAAGERWVGGFYQGRQFKYKAAEEATGLYSEQSDLYRSLSDPAQKIYDSVLGTEVKPWDLEPDRMLTTVDDLADDMYIEQVIFRAPYGLQLVGGDDQRLKVFLKQRGLPGV